MMCFCKAIFQENKSHECFQIIYVIISLRLTSVQGDRQYSDRQSVALDVLSVHSGYMNTLHYKTVLGSVHIWKIMYPFV
jgi:hypothetical protein